MRGLQRLVQLTALARLAGDATAARARAPAARRPARRRSPRSTRACGRQPRRPAVVAARARARTRASDCVELVRNRLDELRVQIRLLAGAQLAQARRRRSHRRCEQLRRGSSRSARRSTRRGRLHGAGASSVLRSRASQRRSSRVQSSSAYGLLRMSSMSAFRALVAIVARLVRGQRDDRHARAPRCSSRWRMSAVAAKPSMPGMLRSMKIESKRSRRAARDRFRRRSSPRRTCSRAPRDSPRRRRH